MRPLKMRTIAAACGIAFLILTPVLAIAYSSSDKQPYDSRPPIVIVGDDDLTEDNGVGGGKGTPEDPYLINGWHIEISGDSGISLVGTTTHILISNITFTCSRPLDHKCAIALEDVTNCTVRDCTIREGYKTGILARCPGLEGVCGLRFINNMFASQSVGIDVEEITGVEISRNIFQKMHNAGIAIRFCTQISVSDNLVIDPWESCGIRVDKSAQISVERVKMKSLYHGEYDYGIDVQNVTGMTITDSHFNYNYGVGAAIRVLLSNDVEIEGCEIRGPKDAVSVSHSSQCLLKDNAFFSIDGVSVTDSYEQSIDSNRFWASRLVIESSENISIDDNHLATEGWSTYYPKTGYISITEVTNLSVDRNCILGAYGAGVAVHQCARVTITGNAIQDCVPSFPTTGTAVRTISVSCLNISENRIGNNLVKEDQDHDYDEIYLSDCDGAVLYGNFISHDSVYIDSSVSPTVRLNTLSGNGRLYLSQVENGLVSANNFGDGYSAYLVGLNDTQFDSGYPAGGNHWSSHVGVDLYSGPSQDILGDDGIVDTPYVEGTPGAYVVIDNYPLVDAVALGDHEPPITMAMLKGAKASKSNVWYTGNVTVNLTALDAATEVDRTDYRVDGAAWTEYGSPFEISSNGKHLLEFFSVDASGNAELIRSIDVWIDKERPTIEGVDPSLNSTVTRSGAVVRFDASDNVSGILLVGWSLQDFPSFPGEGTATFESMIWEPRDGVLTITLYAMDEAGNIVRLDGVYVFDTEPLSLTGPYGPWFIAGVIVDLVLLAVLIVYLERRYVAIMEARIGEVRWPDGRPGTAEVPETREDVEDGYPKYMKKM